jgi:hypothetical protein
MIMATFVLAGAAAATAPAAGAQVVFDRGNAIWVMNDDGSGQRQLISASQASSPSDYQAPPTMLMSPDVFQNGGQAVVFQGKNSSCADRYCSGIYLLNSGSASQLSPPPEIEFCGDTYDEYPRITLDSQAAFEYEEFTTDALSGCPPTSFTHTIDTRQLSTGRETSWNTGSAGLPYLVLPAPDPVNTNLMAWVEGQNCQLSGSSCSQYLIHVNDRADATDTIIAGNGNVYPRSVSWSSDGKQVLVADVNGIAESDTTPAITPGKQFPQFYNTSGTGSDPVTQARFMGTSKIVFSQNGNIYTIPTSCGNPAPCTVANATALTTDGGSSEPAWTSATTPIAAFGAVPQTSPPPTPTPTLVPPSVLAPIISNATQSASRWREGNKLAQISRGRKPPVGTTFKFGLNTSASVSFAFTQAKSGRNVAGKCVAQTGRNRKKPKCTQSIVAGTLGITGHAGVNTVGFQGRLTSSRKLKPGLYTLVITATKPGAPSASESLTFTIVL